MAEAGDVSGFNGQYPKLNDPHVVWGKFYKKRGINIWCTTCVSWMGWAEFCCKGCDKKMGSYEVFEHTGTDNHLKDSVYKKRRECLFSLYIWRRLAPSLYREQIASLIYTEEADFFSIQRRK